MGVPPTRAISVDILEAPHFSSATEQLKPLGMTLYIICGTDDLDDGVARARDITARYPGTSEQDCVLRHIDGEFIAHEPDLLATDSSALGILHCAMSASEWMTSKLTMGRGDYDDRTHMQQRILRNLTNASVSDIATLKGLADGIARADTHGVDDELADHVRAAFNSSMSYSSRRDEEVSRGIVNACLDRWDNRPVPALDISNRRPSI
jgi:hypothetical protein